MNKAVRQNSWLIYGLIVLGVAARLVPHPWNATPVMAIALFGGTFLAKRWAVLLPLATVIASDFILGWHNTIPFTWTAFVLTGALAFWIRRKPRFLRIAAASLAGSALFFLITNLGVWWVGELYPRTLEGLRTCFIAAIPFYRNTLLGDLAFTALFFGSAALLPRIIPALRAAPAPISSG